MKHPKDLHAEMWAYYAPDGYVQVRSIAYTRKVSRQMVAFGEPCDWKTYEARGYELRKVRVVVVTAEGSHHALGARSVATKERVPAKRNRAKRARRGPTVRNEPERPNPLRTLGRM